MSSTDTARPTELAAADSMEIGSPCTRAQACPTSQFYTSFVSDRDLVEALVAGLIIPPGVVRVGMVVAGFTSH